MDVTPLIRSDQQVIQSYAGGQFRVSGAVYDHAILVTPQGTMTWEDPVDAIADLTLESFSQIIEMADEIDVVLLGCGAKMAFMDMALKKALSEKGLPVDVMDSGAACRTYNVIMAEGRRVVAALLTV